MMMNGTDLNTAIAPGKDEGNVAKIYKEHRGAGLAIVRDLYLLTLNRPPSQKELTRMTEAMKWHPRQGRAGALPGYVVGAAE